MPHCNYPNTGPNFRYVQYIRMFPAHVRPSTDSSVWRVRYVPLPLNHCHWPPSPSASAQHNRTLTCAHTLRVALVRVGDGRAQVLRYVQAK
jgi:hypothetical protein